VLPVIVVYPDAPSFMLADGVAQCEADDKRPLVMPAVPGSAHYITALPLDPGFFPATRKVELFAEGETQDAVYWKDCVVLRMTLPRPAEAFEPAASIAVAREGGLTACLFRQGGVHLAVEREGLTVWSKTVAEKGWGSLTFLGDKLVCVTDGGCLCVDTADEFRQYLEISGRCELNNGEISCVKKLGTRLGHEEISRFDAATGAVLSRSTKPARQAESAEDAILGLLDAVRLGQNAEARELLGGDLYAIGFAEICGFFGEFDSAELHPFYLGTAGVRKRAERRMREFRFETEERSGCFRVTNAEEQE